jgi:hypothetical protein
VRGYFRSNGTYVQSHHRSSPNRTKWDNYSTGGNVNPYTGQSGHINPYTGISTSSIQYDFDGYVQYGSKYILNINTFEYRAQQEVE